MANRRMFSKDVTNADEFLDMPLSSQALYFHLGMNADDDGFVQPRSIMRLVQAKDDDLKVLRSKGFVIPFKDSVIVITHWKMMNQIQPSRHVKTVYQEHLKFLGLDNGKYEMSTECQQDVDKVSAQYSIGKDSIVENSKVEISLSSELSSQVQKVMEIFYKINPTINWGNKTSRKSAADLIKQFGFEGTVKMAESAISIQGQPYAPTATTPTQLKDRLAQFKIYFDRQKNNNSEILKI